MKSVFARSAIGAPALRAALVSMVMITSALCCRIAVLNAFTAPAGPLSSSSGISFTGRPMMPPLAFSSSTASSADCTTAGATTLFTPERPTGTAMTIGCLSADCAAAPPDSVASPSISARATSVLELFRMAVPPFGSR